MTSYLFPGAKFDEDRLRRLAEKVGKERLVVDVRCVSLDEELPDLEAGTDKSDRVLNIAAEEETTVGSWRWIGGKS